MDLCFQYTSGVPYFVSYKDSCKGEYCKRIYVFGAGNTSLIICGGAIMDHGFCRMSIFQRSEISLKEYQQRNTKDDQDLDECSIGENDDTFN